jgi:hypothetical protein
VTVPAADVELGFKSGEIRVAAHQDRFLISKRPTSVAEYQKCVAAGVCSIASEQANCALERRSA